jgi:hypothetical protein
MGKFRENKNPSIEPRNDSKNKNRATKQLIFLLLSK